MTTLIISINEIEGIMKIVKSLKKLGLLTKDVSKSIENEATEQKQRFLGLLLGTSGASLLGNLLAIKAMKTTR